MGNTFNNLKSHTFQKHMNKNTHFFRQLSFRQLKHSKGGLAAKHNGLRKPQPSVITTIIGR